MNRRDLFRRTTAAAAIAAIPAAASAGSPTASVANPGTPLQPPAAGPIRVAFLLSDDAVVIDFAGPWEVFDNVAIPGTQDNAFQLYTVAATTAPIKASGGMTIVPTYTYTTAPAPQVIVIPAQGEPMAAALDWIRQASGAADLTMSVCNGAFVLAKTGLLSGRTATAYHGSYKQFAMQFPDIQLVRGVRFVESGKVATAGGLSSGIDLALHVVERYFGRAVATHTAYILEYQGRGWLDAQSNQIYATRRAGTAQHPLCPVCDMDVDKTLTSTWRGRRYYFCMDAHRHAFDAHPGQYLPV